MRVPWSIVALVPLILAPLGIARGEPIALEPADELEVVPEESFPIHIAIHGFVSQGFIWSTDNNYLARSSEGSFEFSEAALNVTTQLSERLRVGLQLFTRDLGRDGNYAAKLDWFYLDYRFADWLGLRAGRLKLPFGLYNEAADVDAARVPVLLPASIYPSENRGFLLAQTGGEIYGLIDLDGGGGLEYRLYGGTIFLQAPPAPPGGVQLVDIFVPYVFGGRLMWETPVVGLRVGMTLQSLQFDYKYLVNSTTPLVLEFPIDIWLASLEYTVGDFQLAAEYSRWHAHISASLPELFPDVVTTNERLYGLLSYRISKWLQVAGHYALLYPNMHQRNGRSAYRHDAALTLRFDIDEHWLVKLEGHYLNGTADLQPDINDGKALTALETQWWLFLVKTTAWF